MKSQLTPCPIIAKTVPKISGFELSKAVFEIPPESLPCVERLVLRVLADDYGLFIKPKNDSLAYRTGLNPRSISRTLTRLEKAAYIAVAIGSSRQGDPSRRKDKPAYAPRGGGRNTDRQWKLNVNGILELAGAAEKVAPDAMFSPANIDRGSMLSSEKVEPGSMFKPQNIDRGSENMDCESSNIDRGSTVQSSRFGKNNNNTNEIVKTLCRRFSENRGKPNTALSREQKAELTELVAGKDPTELLAAIDYYAANLPLRVNEDTIYPLKDFIEGLDAYLKHGRQLIEKRKEEAAQRDARIQRMIANPEWRERWEACTETEHQEKVLQDYADARQELFMSNQRWANCSWNLSERFIDTLNGEDRTTADLAFRHTEKSPFTSLAEYRDAHERITELVARGQKWDEANPEPEMYDFLCERVAA